MLLLLLILVILLYLKWILVAFAFPWVCLLFQFRRHKGSLRKVLAVPGLAIEKMTRDGASRYIILNIGHIPSLTLRRTLYRMLGADIERQVVVHYKTEIRAPYRLAVGKGSIIGDNVILDARNDLRIGRNANLSSNVSIYTEQHDYRDPMFGYDNERNKAVVIGDRVWIGSNVVVLPGVTIGEGAVCCAGCVVTRDVAPYDVVAGIPARQVSTRPRSLEYEFDGSSCWFY